MTGRRPSLSGLTLIELMIVVAILAVLTAIGWPNFVQARTRTKVSVTKNNLRLLDHALGAYRTDHGFFPPGRPTPGVDPFGVFSVYALSGLTTPIAYVSGEALRNSFGNLRVPEPKVSAPTLAGDSYRPLPSPQPSLLYFHYLKFAALRRNAALAANAFAVISSGPDREDSLSVFYPFPAQLPSEASRFGVSSIHDTIYDPTNGSISGGDISRWGGEIVVEPPSSR